MPFRRRFAGRRRRFTSRYGALRKRYHKGTTSKDVTFKSYGAAQQNWSRGDYYCCDVMRTNELNLEANAGAAVLAAQTVDSLQFRQQCNQWQMVKVTDYSVTVMRATSPTGESTSVGATVVMAPYRGTPNYLVGQSISVIDTMSGAKAKVITDQTPLTVVCKYPVCQISAQGSQINTNSNSVLKNEWTALPASTGNNALQVPNYSGIAVVKYEQDAIRLVYQEKYKLHFKGRLMGQASTAIESYVPPPGYKLVKEISEPNNSDSMEAETPVLAAEGTDDSTPAQSIAGFTLQEIAALEPQAVLDSPEFDPWRNDIWSKIGKTRAQYMALPLAERTKLCKVVNGAGKIFTNRIRGG